MKIFIDCDNSMGLEGRPMDDALAILYLMGCHEDAEIVGIGCNFGNCTSAETFECTKQLVDETGRKEIPVLHGNEMGMSGMMSPAAEFIVSLVNTYPDEIIYLSIGSLGNLYEACMIDSTVLDKIPQLVMMGGITEPLFIHDQPLHELNFSVFGKASSYVLAHGHNITIITGNNCLPAADLPKDEFLENLCRNENPSGMYVAQKCGYRFRDKELVYGADSSYCWDGVAAAYILHPELFEDHYFACRITEENISDMGFLDPQCELTQEEYYKIMDDRIQTGSGPDRFVNSCGEMLNVLNIPEVRDRRALQQLFYDGWLNLNIETKNADYACFGLYLDRLIQPCVLIELSHEPAYGFQLLQRLKEDGYAEDNLDPSGFYRNLKRMERDGYLRSEPASSGEKAKRIYHITDFGRMTLLNWEDSLRKYHDHIGRIVKEIETSVLD